MRTIICIIYSSFDQSVANDELPDPFNIDGDEASLCHDVSRMKGSGQTVSEHIFFIDVFEYLGGV